MWELLILTSRLLGLIAGLVLIYVAIFLYEDEAGKIQNVLENMWLKIEERRSVAMSRQLAFVRISSGLAENAFDRVLGRKPISKRSIGVSASLSIASIYLLVLVAPGIFPFGYVLNDRTRMFFLISLFVYLILAVLPTWIHRHSVITAWFWAVLLSAVVKAPIAYRVAGLPLSEVFSTKLLSRNVLFTLGISVGIVCDLLFLAFSRRMLRWNSGALSFSILCLAALLNFVFAFVILFAPAWSHIGLEASRERGGSWFLLGRVIWYAVTSNLFIAIVALGFFTLGLTVVLHRALWPVLERPIYALQRLGIAKRSKLLGSLGVALVFASTGGPSWLAMVVEKLNP